MGDCFRGDNLNVFAAKFLEANPNYMSAADRRHRLHIRLRALFCDNVFDNGSGHTSFGHNFCSLPMHFRQEFYSRAINERDSL
jgi:hypothetical protein